MSEKDKRIEESETPTQKKLKALMRSVTTGDIEYETVIPQALVTIIIVGGAMWMTIQGNVIPEWLSLAIGAIIGFYFGSDYQYRREQKKGS